MYMEELDRWRREMKEEIRIWREETKEWMEEREEETWLRRTEGKSEETMRNRKGNCQMSTLWIYYNRDILYRLSVQLVCMYVYVPFI